MGIKITFYKNALNSNGEPYESVLGSYTFSGNLSEEEAIQSAISQFISRYKISRWQDYADRYDVL